jgi:hypothetical protein
MTQMTMTGFGGEKYSINKTRAFISPLPGQLTGVLVP